MTSQSEKARDPTENGDTNGPAPVQDTAHSDVSSKSMSTELMALIATYQETKDRKFLKQAMDLAKSNMEKAVFCGNRMLYKLACGDEGLTEEESEGAHEEFCVMVPEAREWSLKPAHLQFVTQGLREAGLTLVPQQIRAFMAAVVWQIDSGKYGTVGAGDLARKAMDIVDHVIGRVPAMPLLDEMLKAWLKLEAVKLAEIAESSRAHTAALKGSLDDDKVPQEVVAIMSTYGEIADVDAAKLLATRMYKDTAGEVFKIQEHAEEKLETLVEVLQALNKD
ncbi:hypothetical protein SLS58_007413 [Diplodia intermedia]|uniref:Uncharacterized protein n=1 Tax=Diplodia intermedia TaxID=856260 RepID=A0ABR3TKA2_9PEZI